MTKDASKEIGLRSWAPALQTVCIFPWCGKIYASSNSTREHFTSKYFGHRYPCKHPGYDKDFFHPHSAEDHYQVKHKGRRWECHYPAVGNCIQVPPIVEATLEINMKSKSSAVLPATKSLGLNKCSIGIYDLSINAKSIHTLILDTASCTPPSPIEISTIDMCIWV
jgi:hypothetical protein